MIPQRQESYVEVDSNIVLDLAEKMTRTNRLTRQRNYRKLIRSLIQTEKRRFFGLIVTRKARKKPRLTPENCAE